MAELKTQPTEENVTAYLDRVVEGERRTDCDAILEMLRAATGAEPVLWGSGLIGFGRYKYHYRSGREGEWPIICFASRKDRFTLYIVSSFQRFPELIARLGKHKMGGSCLHIKKLADVDKAVLEEIVTESVQALADKRVD